jgi:nucleotide-binding universal stress UspA family protein
MTDNETNGSPKPLTLVVGISDDITGARAWRRAARIARAAPKTKLHLCHCAGEARGDPEKQLAEAEKDLGRWALTQLAGDELIERAEIHVGVGDPPGVLRQLAVDVEADMIVVGTHHKGTLERLVKGSVVHELMLDAPCSVVVAMPDEHDQRPKSPAIEPPPPENATTPNIASPHRYHYRRSVRFNFPNSSFGTDRTPA